MTVEEKAYNYASKVVKNRLTASEVAAHYGRGYIEGQEDMKQFGWHPASEFPPLDGKKNSKPVIAICGIPDPLNYGRVLPRFSAVVGGVWTDKDVKWWCYPPEKGN